MEVLFLSNAPRFAKKHCSSEGSHASPVCQSGKSNMQMKMRMEHWLEKCGYSKRTSVIFSSKYKHPSRKVAYTRRHTHSYILYSCILQTGFNTDVLHLNGPDDIQWRSKGVGQDGYDIATVLTDMQQ